MKDPYDEDAIPADLLSAALSSLVLSISNSSRTPGSNSSTDITNTANNAEHHDGANPRYFEQFKGFKANNHASVQNEFKRLAKHHGWNNKTKKTKDFYYEQKIDCYRSELHHFSNPDQPYLQLLQSLCLDFQIAPIPSSIIQCKKALGTVQVNIFDWLNAKRCGSTVAPIFTSKVEFATYTVAKGKLFPKEAAKAHPYFKVLLEEVFRYLR